MSANSFLHPLGELHHGSYLPADAPAALKQTQGLAWKRLDALLELKPTERTFDNTALALTRSTDEYDFITGVIGHLERVIGGPWHEVGQMAAQHASELANTIQFHSGLYQALIDYHDHTDLTALSQPRQKLLADLIRDYERGGIALPADQQTELKDIRTQLSLAMMEFGQNAVKAEATAGLHLKTKAELKGLSQDFIAACQAEAKQRGLKGYWIAYSQPAYLEVMSVCSVAATRQQLYHLNMRLAAKVNPPLANKILKLRLQVAQLLGYQNYADFVLAERMAKDGQTAHAFIQDLTQRYRPAADKEFAAITDFARTIEQNPKLSLDVADTMPSSYYHQLMRAEQVGIGQEELKPYLQLDRVLTKMFETLSTLYGVNFKPVALPAWHKDVTAYEIRDQNSHHLATVWCDWFARPDKHSGAWMDLAYIADRANDNFDQPHLGYVTANFTPPTKTKPSLLTLRDVETMWHEFGHFMHAAFGRPELTEQSIQAIKWDFIEAPSQIMENWVWQPDILKDLAQHCQTGESLSDEILAKLERGRNFEVATTAMRQLQLAITDLSLHIDYDPEGSTDILEHCLNIRRQYLPVPPLPDDAWISMFTHVFAGGYASAYYSYKWAEAIEADLFSRFAKEGALNPKTGAAYRDQVLARGAEIDPPELIQAFLGRDSTIDAMLERDGIN